MRIGIKALQRRLSVTSVCVTHDKVDAMTMDDRIIVRNTGRIEQIGTPSGIPLPPEFDCQRESLCDLARGRGYDW